ncbi:MAG TPA: DUF4147 domain-containing protein [Blastocatellia bacterium]|nr:DUF4147 domain-containing protein [Blastocatellia bacterium]
MTDLEQVARTIFFETLKAVDLPAVIRRRVRRDGERLWVDEKVYDLSRFDEVILIGIGKASLQMGQAIESLLGERLSRGLLVSNRRAPLSLKSEVIIAGHPVPNAESLRAGKRAIELLSGCTPNTLVLFLISGGGSSLFEVPISDEITLEDLRQLNRILVECGATIEEVNVVRKRFSAIKGGKLRKIMKSQAAVALLVSDVNTGDFKTLASNPLFPEAESEERFQGIIEKYKLAERLPRLFQLFQALHRKALRESNERPDPHIAPILLAENTDVVKTAERIALESGYYVQVDQIDDEAPIEQAAARFVALVKELKRQHPGEKVCVISGGEVSCPVRGDGFGGRNQELALLCAMKLQEALIGGSLVLSCGTDGIDGRSFAVGALAHAGQPTNERLTLARLPVYLAASDSSSWFNEAGGLLVSGPTGNNLRDLRIILTN